MSTNATVMVSLTTELTYTSLLNEEFSQKIYIAFRYVILPCASVLGIVGNANSIVILARRGSKCSNVLLMALSVSDVLFLTGINNIPKYIFLGNVPQGFRSSETINYILYTLYMAFLFASTVGLMSALVIPALITGERLLAILSPLKVYFILSPRRVLLAVSCVYSFSGAYFLYRYIICMYFKHVVVDGFTVGLFWQTDVCADHFRSGLYGLIESIANYMTGIIPISIVTAGCVVIGFQVAIMAHRRKQLTSSQVNPGTNTSPTRTTKMLLMICIMHIACSGFAFLLTYVAEMRPIDQDFALQTVLGCLQDFLLSINCVGDLFIYVRANNRLRRPNYGKR